MPLDVVNLVLESRYGRDCRARVTPELGAWYETTLTTLWRTVRVLTSSDGGEPFFEVVHSPQSLPQLVKLSARPTLVYDQHLGQVFARLTRLTRADAAPALVDAYLMKLGAVRLLARGQWETARLLASASLHLRNQAPALRDDLGPAALVRLRLVQGQEAFALAHELGHYLKSEQPAAFSSFESDVAELVEGWALARQAPSGDPDYVLDEMTRSAVDGWERRNGPLTSDQRDQVRRVFAADASGVDVAGDARNTLDVFHQDAELHEEVVCDVLASLCAIVAVLREGGSVVEGVQAAAYAMHHLRLIQTVHSVVDETNPGLVTEGLRGAASRLTILRACLGPFTTALFGDAGMTVESCHDVVTSINLTHARVIGDQLWLHTSPVLRELVALPSSGSVAGEDAVVGLREALGFGAPKLS